MNKEQYIKQELLKSFLSFSSLLLLIATIGILLLSILDYFVTPENFKLFLTYRVIAASLYFVLLLIFKKIKKFPLIFIILAALIISIMVELMILSFGGHQSPYYAGFIIIFVFLFGLLPMSFKITLSLTFMIYAIYLLPILFLDTITNPRIFLNNNIFLIATLTGGLIWRYINYKLHVNKLSLEYDLAQERQRLKVYSEQLEDLVAERTKELRKSETMLRSLYEKANDTIILTDENGKIINVNKKVTDQYGYTKDELIGKSLLSLEQNQDNQLFLERNHRLLHGEPLVYESTHIASDGTPVHVEVSASAVTLEDGRVIQFIIRDITEKKKLQAQLLHAQRMESLGTLAGGIAHDFNNLLTSIMGYTDLILDEGKLPPELVPKMRVIESSTRKATQIVSKLLNFAKRGRELELVPFNVNDMIREALELAKRRFNPGIEVELALKENLPIIKGDVGLLEQSVLNLILNAIDAMPEGGNLNIETELVKIDSNYKKRIAPDVKEGPYIRISVKDSGAGIPPDKIDRIFDPFFTTKGPDKGTGLGLAMTYGIVKDHGGYITVDSVVGKGTSFEIYLPASQTVIPGITSILDSLRTTGKIMVIDDEIPVLEFFKVTLLQKGFNVVVFNDPYAAYEYFKSHKSLIELIISDIVMPEIDGKKLIKEIKCFKNDVKIIAMSGFKDALMDLQADGYLVKPVKKETLFEEIQRVMSSPDKSC